MRVFTLIVYVIIGLFLAWFASNNFGRVTMWLPGDYEANWPFAVYLLAALLLGALPISADAFGQPLALEAAHSQAGKRACPIVRPRPRILPMRAGEEPPMRRAYEAPLNDPQPSL